MYVTHDLDAEDIPNTNQNITLASHHHSIPPHGYALQAS
jgi:hypothetical protein